MKKLTLVMIMMFLCAVVYADSSTPEGSYYSEQKVLNMLQERSSNTLATKDTRLDSSYDSATTTIRTAEKNKRGTTTAHRISVLSGDGSTPPTLGSGVDCSGYNRALVSFSMSEDTSWVAVPLFGNSTSNMYHRGTARTLSGDSETLIDVAGSDDFYILLQDPPGKIGTVSVWVTPTN